MIYGKRDGAIGGGGGIQGGGSRRGTRGTGAPSRGGGCRRAGGEWSGQARARRSRLGDRRRVGLKSHKEAGRGGRWGRIRGGGIRCGRSGWMVWGFGWYPFRVAFRVVGHFLTGSKCSVGRLGWKQGCAVAGGDRGDLAPECWVESYGNVRTFPIGGVRGRDVESGRVAG